MTDTNGHIFGTDPAAMRLLRELKSLNQQFVSMLCAAGPERHNNNDGENNNRYDNDRDKINSDEKDWDNIGKHRNDADSIKQDGLEPIGGEFAELREQMRNLDAAEQDKIASCPYALFDLDLCNSKRWTGLLSTKYSSDQVAHTNTTQFILAALCFAQRLAQEHADLGILLLGMNASVCLQLQESTIGQLMVIAQSSELNLQPRLSQDPNFWPDLVNFVHDGTPEQYLAAQTCALQLVAAGSA